MIPIRTVMKFVGRYLEHRRGVRLPLICCWLITDKCPLSCEGCFFYDRVFKDQKALDSKGAHGILDRMIDINLPVLYLAGGEPLVRKDLFELMEKARRHNIFTVLYTNGLLITKENAALVDRVFNYAFVSLDGLEPEHEILRKPGSFKPALRGLEHLLAARSKSKIGVNTVITRHNADTIPAYLDWIETLGLDQLKIHPHYFKPQRPTADQVRPVVKKLMEIKNRKPKYLIGGRKYFSSWIDLLEKGESTPCDELENIISLGVMPNGDVSACGSFYAPLGNLMDHSFEQIVSGDLSEKLAAANTCDGCFRYDAPLLRYLFETPPFRLRPKKLLAAIKG